MRRLVLILLPACGCFLGICSAVSAGATAVAPAEGDSFENPPEPLAPRKARSEAEEDRITALALFSAGRGLEQRDQLPQALRHYERRFVTILRHCPCLSNWRQWHSA